jgi:hypothetical protein
MIEEYIKTVRIRRYEKERRAAPDELVYLMSNLIQARRRLPCFTRSITSRALKTSSG